jgi:hypothetical protein
MEEMFIKMWIKDDFLKVIGLWHIQIGNVHKISIIIELKFLTLRPEFYKCRFHVLHRTALWEHQKTRHRWEWEGLHLTVEKHPIKFISHYGPWGGREKRRERRKVCSGKVVSQSEEKCLKQDQWWGNLWVVTHGLECGYAYEHIWTGELIAPESYNVLVVYHG